MALLAMTPSMPARVDTIIGLAGVDVIDGGLGVDTVDYSGATVSSTAGIGLALNTSTNATVVVGTSNVGADTVKNVENVIGTSGADAISGDSAANRLQGNDGADRFGLTGRVETITVATTATTGDLDAADKVKLTFNGVDTADVTYGASATLASVASAIAAAINATSETSFVTATAADGVVTVNYAQYFGTAGAVKSETDADSDTTFTFAATAAGANAGDDTIVGGAGADTILGGAGSDTFVFAGTNAAGLTAEAGDSILDFSVASDVIVFAGAALINGAGTTGGTYASSEFTEVAYNSAAAVAIVSGAAAFIYEVTGLSLNATSAANAATVASALDLAFDFANNTAANGDFIFAVSDGTNSYIWLYDGNTSDATFDAGEMTLLSTLSGVTAGSLAYTNFNFG